MWWGKTWVNLVFGLLCVFLLVHMLVIKKVGTAREVKGKGSGIVRTCKCDYCNLTL